MIALAWVEVLLQVLVVIISILDLEVGYHG
jgi:hypothetical protein